MATFVSDDTSSASMIGYGMGDAKSYIAAQRAKAQARRDMRGFDDDLDGYGIGYGIGDLGAVRKPKKSKALDVSHATALKAAGPKIKNKVTTGHAAIKTKAPAANRKTSKLKKAGVKPKPKQRLPSIKRPTGSRPVTLLAKGIKGLFGLGVTILDGAGVYPDPLVTAGIDTTYLPEYSPPPLPVPITQAVTTAPKGYEKRKAKGNLRPQDQFYEMSVSTQQQLASVMTELQNLEYQSSIIQQRLLDLIAFLQTPDPSKQCATGTYYDQESGQCFPGVGPGQGCEVGYTISPVTGQCIPVGGGGTQQCPAGMVMDQYSGQCVPYQYQQPFQQNQYDPYGQQYNPYQQQPSYRQPTITSEIPAGFDAGGGDVYGGEQAGGFIPDSISVTPRPSYYPQYQPTPSYEVSRPDVMPQAQNDDGPLSVQSQDDIMESAIPDIESQEGMFGLQGFNR